MLIITWMVILFAFREQLALVVTAWDTLPSHAHGYVVLLIVAYLAWTKRTQLGCTPLFPSYIGLALFSLAALAALVGDLASAAVVVQFSLVFMLIFGVWATMGNAAFRTLMGPLCFLFFAVPFGHDILPLLMDWTANATVWGLRASGIPVLQMDRHFVIPSGSWSVIEACSGLRYLFTSFFVGSIFAYITYRHWLKRVTFVAAMLLLSLIANWFRAYAIVMIAHLTDNQWGFGLSHLAFGWVIFGIVVFLAFFIGARWADPEPEVAAITAGQVAPLPRIAIAAFAASALALASSAGAGFLMNTYSAGYTSATLDVGPAVHGLETIQPQLPQLMPSYVGATTEIRNTYRFQNAEIQLYVAYYRNQTQGRELVNVNNLLESSKTWEWRSSQRQPSENGLLQTLHSEQYTKVGVIAHGARIYWIGGFLTQSDSVSKLLQVFNLLRGRGDDSAAIIISASAETDDHAKQALAAFIDERLPKLINVLNQMGTQPK